MAYTSTKSALKFQASAMNSCWEKWDRKLIVKWMDRHTRVIQYTPISFGAREKNTLKLRLNDSYLFFIKHMQINVLGHLVTTKQLTLYFLRKSAKIIYNGLFPSFFFFCFWENGFRKECTSSAVGKQSSERNLAPSTGNWVVLAFHIASIL